MSRTLPTDPGEVQAIIERLLMEQGEVAPVEVLLLAGCLDYRDYEAWRESRVAFLEDVLHCPAQEVRRLLRAVAASALAQGLAAEERANAAWRGQSALRCSRGPDEELFCTHHRPPADRGQLDLFYDGREAALVNGLRLAFAARRSDQALRLLRELRRTLPHHPHAGLYERLAAAQAALDAPAREPSIALASLLHDIEPAARAALGAQARDYLVPHWRRLAQALAEQPFDPRHPELHGSFIAARTEDWDGVRRAVEAEPRWRREPVLIERHATACERLGEKQAALADWVGLCWDLPADAAQHLARSGIMGAAWADFQDIEPPLDATDFPAWLVLRGGASLSPPPGTANLAARQVLDLVQRLVMQPRGTPPDPLVAARRALRAMHPRLFELYMATIRGIEQTNSSRTAGRGTRASPRSRR